MKEIQGSGAFLNLFDYLEKYKDVPFSEKPLGEVDLAVFAAFSYVVFETAVPLHPYVPDTMAGFAMDYLSTRSFRDVPQGELLLRQERVPLCCRLLRSKRFSPLLVSAFRHELSESDETQFAAFEFELPGNVFLVEFRGTDNTMLGWKENFDLACEPEVYGEKLALAFLKDAIRRHPGWKGVVSGHSKGGHLAVFAASMLDPEEVKSIASIVSLDGNGQDPSVFLSEGHQRIVNRIQFLVPEDDIVGIVMAHEKETKVLKTSTPGDFIKSHSYLNWAVEDDHFLTVESRSPLSYYLEASLEELLYHKLANLDQRKRFFEAAYQTMLDTGVIEPTDIFLHSSVFLRRFMTQVMTGPKENRKILLDSLRMALDCFTANRPLYNRKLKEAKIREEKRKKEEAQVKAQSKAALVKKTA